MSKASEVVDRINGHELLAASIDDDGLITIEYLGRCGNRLVADCIDEHIKGEPLVWVRSDESANLATYKLA